VEGLGIDARWRVGEIGGDTVMGTAGARKECAVAQKVPRAASETGNERRAGGGRGTEKRRVGKDELPGFGGDNVPLRKNKNGITGAQSFFAGWRSLAARDSVAAVEREMRPFAKEGSDEQALRWTYCLRTKR